MEKGIRKNVVKKKIHFDDYLRHLENLVANPSDKSNYILHRTPKCTQLKLHDVDSLEQIKIALNPYDDKRYLTPNSHDTLPWRQYSIKD